MIHPAFCVCEFCTAGPMSKSRKKRVEVLDKDLQDGVGNPWPIKSLEEGVMAGYSDFAVPGDVQDVVGKIARLEAEVKRLQDVISNRASYWNIQHDKVAVKNKTLESELRKWNAPHDIVDLQELKEQSEQPSLAAKQAYINGLEHRVKGLEAEIKGLRERIDNISQRMYDMDMGEQLAILELKALAAKEK